MDRRARFAPACRIAFLAALALALVAPAAAQRSGPTQVSPAGPRKPASPPARPAAPLQPQAVDPAEPQFIFSAWTKICGKDGPEGSSARDVCGVLSEARTENGQTAAAVALVEPQDGSPRVLRLTLPLGVRLPQGTRVTFDQGTPAQSNYLMCLGTGCISDYDANADVVAKLRKAQSLTVYAVNPGGYPISISFPLKNFAKADDGPAIDSKAFAEQNKKLEEGLRSRAEEVRKQLEGRQPQGAPPGSGPSTPSAK
jgi:invasion protein IalB